MPRLPIPRIGGAKVAKLRHIAVAVPDPEKSARFYKQAFGMDEVGRTESELASGVYLSDGTICLALLRYKTDEAAGRDRGRGFVGVHHMGFWCDSLDNQSQEIEALGGTFFMDLPTDRTSLHFERKYRDPDGVIFDISENGWVGAAR
jgi:catechol 2,3-dioxygenase-like lactoylglutathione lyase family enzyme